MLEVQRPFLLTSEFVGEHSVDRAPDDSGFDERARVDADNGDAVIHRVVVVRPRFPIDRVGARSRPQAHRLVRRGIEVLPLLRVLRMRTNQQRRAPQFRIVR